MAAICASLRVNYSGETVVSLRGTQGVSPRKKGLMKISLRLALLACASFLGLALAAPALAAYNPSLTMEQSSYKLGAAITADVFIAIDPNDDPTAKLTIFSPAGYSANLTAAPGTKIGSRGRAREGECDLGERAADARRRRARRQPGRPGDPGRGDAVHARRRRTTTVWVLNTSLQGQTISIPVFVNRSGRSSRSRSACLSPDVPPETPGRAPFGAQAGRRRLHDQGRLQERRPDRRLRVGRHLHAVHAGHGAPRTRAARSSARTLRRPAVVADAQAHDERSAASSSSAS